MPWPRVLVDEADIKDRDEPRIKTFTEEEQQELSLVPAGNPHWFQITGVHHLMSVASYYAQLTDIKNIALGFIKEQADAIPGLSAAMVKWGEFMSLLNPACGPFTVLTPVMDKTKAEIVQLAVSLGIPLQATWSCCFSREMHCGECNRCIERKSAFAAAGMVDKTRYIK